jgi:hypothetical protein
MVDDKRKHRFQMEPAEIEAVEKLIHSQPSSVWKFGPHASERMKAKGVTHEDIIETLQSGYLVEINENRDLCVVFRHDVGKSSVCVVVSLRTRWFVTTWRNGRKDRHNTLDRSKYSWNVDVTRIVSAFA